MSRNTKIVLGIIAAIVILCVCVCAVGVFAMLVSGNILYNNALMDSPEEAANFARTIIDYELPPGYQEEAAMNLGIVQTIYFFDAQADTRSNARPMIMLFSTTAAGEVDEEEFRLQVQLNVQRYLNDDGSEMRFVETRDDLIRGQVVPIYVFEGTDANGIQVRQYISGLFDGKNCQVMMFIGGPVGNWEQDEIDAFLDSIR